MKQGTIPENLRFHSQGKSKVRFRWEDMEEAEQKSKEYEVFPTYVADAKNKKTNETGEKWGKQERYHWDGKTHTKLKAEYSTVDRPNDPIKDIRILDLEIRGQGGRAYKVLIEDRYYVDLREDVLLDVIFECGIDKGGKLRGEFIFATVGSQMKLVRVGSLLHDKLIESTKVSNTKAIKDFQVGGVYERKSGVEVYAGIFSTRGMTGELKETKTGGYRSDYKEVITGAGPSFNVHLFIEEDRAKKLANGKIDEYLVCSVALIKSTSSFKIRKDYDINIAPHIDKAIDHLRKKGYEYSSDVNHYYREPEKLGCEGENAWKANLSRETGYINPKFNITE